MLSLSYVDDPGTYQIDPGTHFAGDWFVENDQGTLGVLDAGDTVAWQKGTGKETAGLIWGNNAFGTIQAAINAVAPFGDTIYVAQGVYSEHILIDRSVNIEGDNALSTILDGDEVNVGISISNGGVTATVTGFNIRNWDSGVWVEGATATLSSSIVGGSVNNGVGVVDGGTVIVIGCDITGNRYGIVAGASVQAGYAYLLGADLSGNTLTGLRVLAKGVATVASSNLSGYTGLGQKAITNTNVSATVNASGNYWGSTNDATILGYTTGAVDISPYLSTAAASQPDVGFAGDYSSVYVTALGRQTGSVGRIQEGVNLVSDGGAANILKGVYYESNIAITKPMTIDGQSRDGVVLYSSLADSNVNSSFGGSVVSYGFLLQSGGVTIRDLTIDGDDPATPSVTEHRFRGGVMTDHRIANPLFSNIMVENVAVQHTYRRGIQIYSPQGMGRSNSVVDCKVDDVVLGAGHCYF